ncbi:PREDICTED: RH-like protein [Chaetura pelagica]|uniref:RH-like protein n=1 Tax=Chaetura pelagica TaxID=8897 RepID=UPI00052367F6|nr:PREDICTED: RH-like protein [Chaetura pelagica]
MASTYRNFLTSVPWLILCLEAVCMVLFFFLGFDISPLIPYPAFQDVNHMMVFGFGFFLTFLKRYGFSSTGFNLLIIAVGVQCSVLVEALLHFLIGGSSWFDDSLKRITQASVSMTSVVISTGVILGRANPLQLILMTVVEIIFFHISRCINTLYLEVPYSNSLMHVHLFGAYFGLAVSSQFPEPSPRAEKSSSTPKSDLFSMLGTLFLWVFWPSFNSVLFSNYRQTAIYNTYFALAVSAVTAFVLSVLTTKDGKFRMTDIHSAALAGGVAVGYAMGSIQHPWIAMILGLLASVIAILGSSCLQRCLNPALKIHDATGVHFTFGLPAVLGGLAHLLLVGIEGWINISSLGSLVMTHLGAICQTISVALVTGFITGLILNLRPFKTTPVSKYFDDQFYWEFPHLAVGF